jgi:hypothetical protein
MLEKQVVPRVEVPQASEINALSKVRDKKRL